MRRVFISYCHQHATDPAFKGRVLDVASTLRAAGVHANLDQWAPFPPPSWPDWMFQQIRDADVVLVIGSSEYKARVEDRAGSGRGTGAAWEGAIVTTEIYYDQTQAGERFVPAILGGDPREQIPYFLVQTTVYDLLDPDAFARLVLHLKGIPAMTPPPVAADAWSFSNRAPDTSDQLKQDAAVPVTSSAPLQDDIDARDVSLDEVIDFALDHGWSIRETLTHTRFEHGQSKVFLLSRRSYRSSTVLRQLLSAIVDS